MRSPAFLRRACFHQSSRQVSLVPLSYGKDEEQDPEQERNGDTKHLQNTSSPGQTSFHMVRSLHQKGQLERSIEILSHIPELCPNHKLYLSLLKDCIQKKALHLTKKVQLHLLPHKAKLPCFLNDYVVVCLAKCGGIEEALQSARTLTRRTVFSWTAIISSCVECDRPHEAIHLYSLMQKDNVFPDHYTIVSVLKACGNVYNLEIGEKLHQDARKFGFLSDIFIGNTLVSMYGKNGAIDRAEDVFRGLMKHNEVSCNAMLSVYVENGQADKALRLYRQMQAERVCCNELTFAITSQGCLTLAEKEEYLQCPKVMALEIGRALLYDAQRRGFGSDGFVCNMFICLFGKFGTLAEAELTFGNLVFQDVKSWTIMFCAYVDQGRGDRALQFYRQMHVNGIHPDAHMFVTAFHACVTLAEKKVPLEMGSTTRQISLDIGVALHQDVKSNGLTSNVFVNTALLTLYWKCGKLLEAEGVFNKLSQRSIVSWTAMLSAYVEHDQHAKALCLYQKMRQELVTMDDVTLVCVLQACSETGNLEITKHLHFIITLAGECGQKNSLPATLVHAYSSCASMDNARNLFDGLIQPDVVSWGACIAGYAAKGNFTASLGMFATMEQEGIRPNEILFASVLSACSHSGLVCEALGYFNSMVGDYSISRSMKHYINMVDLFGRVGDFGRLENMLKNMPMQADITIWLCVLGMCHRHGQVQLAKMAFDNAVSLQPRESVAYILMSNIYAEVIQRDSSATDIDTFYIR